MSPRPMVTFIIVARDAARTLPGALEDLLAQDYPHGLLQILLVDGRSADGTRGLAEEFRRGHPGLDVAVLDNPGRLLASGWNVALERARGDVILRVDAHARFPPDFVRRSVEALAPGRDIAGGSTLTEYPEGTAARLIALVENSRFGGGAAAFRRRGSAGFVDTLAHAAYRREVFARVGGYDETLARTEDNEIHHRMRKAGYRFWYDPGIVSTRRARATFAGLLRQKFGNGYWIGLTLGVAPGAFGPRHLVPGAAVLAGAGAAFLAARGRAVPAEALGAAYGAAAAAAAVAAARGEGWKVRAASPLLMPMFFLVHSAYGLGTIAGLASLPVFLWRRRGRAVPRPVTS